MESIYEVGIINARDCVIIRRKPSEVPINIDRELMHIGTIGHMDGPNSKMLYEFMFKDGLAKAEKFLQSCGWKVNSV